MASRTGRIISAGAFARAAQRYWLSVFPSFRCEMRGWQAHARAIVDPALRDLALEAQRAKRRSLEGAVAFAAFVPRSAQRPIITALAAYQVIFDYLDTLAEQPNPDPISNGRRRWRLPAPSQPRVPGNCSDHRLKKRARSCRASGCRIGPNINVVSHHSEADWRGAGLASWPISKNPSAEDGATPFAPFITDPLRR